MKIIPGDVEKVVFSSQEVLNLALPQVGNQKIVVDHDSLVLTTSYGTVIGTPSNSGSWTISLAGSNVNMPSKVLSNPLAGIRSERNKNTEFAQFFDLGLPTKNNPITEEEVAFAIVGEILSVRAELEFHHHNFNALTARIPSLFLCNAGGACPFQAEGYLDGLHFYFRYRGGHASLKLAYDEDGIFDTPLYSAGVQFGGDFDGFLTDEEFTVLFCHLVRKLKRSSVRWEFESQVPGQRSVFAWGDTMQEAWDNLHSHDDESYISTAQWLEHLEELKLNPQSATVDERVFPEKVNFTVLEVKTSKDPSLKELEIKAVERLRIMLNAHDIDEKE